MPSSTTGPRTVAVYLTAAQASYLASHNADQVITMVSNDGWIFAENAETVGEGGSGLWVDAGGNEHFGPGQDSVDSEAAEKFYTTPMGEAGMLPGETAGEYAQRITGMDAPRPIAPGHEVCCGPEQAAAAAEHESLVDDRPGQQLAAAVRSTLGSLPFQPPEAVGSLVHDKLRPALDLFESRS